MSAIILPESGTVKKVVSLHQQLVSTVSTSFVGVRHRIASFLPLDIVANEAALGENQLNGKRKQKKHLL
jgi:hypothetical protein